MLGYLTELEMRYSAINSYIADSIEQPSPFSVSAPCSEQFTYAIALFSLLQPAAPVVEKLFDQGAMRRKLIWPEISESQIANVVCG
jgi:hypothetical protein